MYAVVGAGQVLKLLGKPSTISIGCELPWPMLKPLNGGVAAPFALIDRPRTQASITSRSPFARETHTHI